MNDSIFSRRILVGWIAAAVVVFAVTLYFMGGGELGGPAGFGPSTYSRSAIGHAGIVDVLQRLDIPVIKSRYNSLEKISSGSVLVIAEPPAGRQGEENLRTLLKADTILLVLPKWAGVPAEKPAGWVRHVNVLSNADVQLALRLIVPNGEVVRQSTQVTWTTNALGVTPNLSDPYQLIRGNRLVPIIGGAEGMLVGEITNRNQKIWILSDPDVIANHGLVRAGNAELAVALIGRLRRADGVIVFDETIHGYLEKPANPILLMFRFPFVVATAQAVIAIALLLWATLARFGAPQSAPASLNVGRQGLLQNVAKLIEFTGHQQVIIRRYVQETIRDVARQLHAPNALAGEHLVAWLQRVGSARGVTVDCGEIATRASQLAEGRRRDPMGLVRVARDIYRWKREIIDGRASDSRTH